MTDRVPHINEWDMAIMKTFPYRFALLWDNPANFKLFDDIKDWARQNFDCDDFTWKSLTFYFKHEEDAVMFKLRWL